MYPTIHDYAATNLQSQGYGALADCIDCTVTEELNGAFTLELTYPLNGINSQYLSVGNIVVAKPSHNQTRQPFRISEVKKSFANNIQVYANHICYDLSGYPIRSAYTLTSLANVISTLNGLTWTTGSSPYHQFEFGTDITSAKTFTMPATQTVRSWMGGQDGSILDVYGGEWVYNNFSCFLKSRRGTNTGYRISYGKNLAEYEKQRDYTEYSHVCAYWKKSDTTVSSDLISTGISCAFRCAYIDATSSYNTQPSTAQLNSYASGQVSSMNFGAQTITVTPAQIGNDVIGLGDSVLICYESVFQMRVIKTVWNVLTGTYNSLQLGSKKTSITDTIKSLSTSPNGESGSSTNQADYITEQGYDGAWYWRKWNSGIAECWTVDYSLGNQAATSGYGNGYYKTMAGLTFHSGLFNSTPNVQISFNGSNGLYFAAPYNCTASVYNFYISSLRSETLNNVKLNVYARGLWKAFNS